MARKSIRAPNTIADNLSNIPRDERREYVKLLLRLAGASNCGPYSVREMASSYHRLIKDGLAQLIQLADGRVTIKAAPHVVRAELTPEGMHVELASPKRLH